MILSSEDQSQFIRLYTTLLGFIAERIGPIAGIADTATFREADNASRHEVRNALLKHPELLREFVRDNPAGLSQEELELVAKWEHFVHGDFIIERELKSYTVFLNTDSLPKAYGVLGLTEEIATFIPMFPAYVNAVLLPWKGRIVWDGLMMIENLYFGGNMQKDFAESYREAKARGIITSLEPGWTPPSPAPAKKAKSPAIARFIKKCPRTVAEFQQIFGEPRMDMGLDAAEEYSVWSIEGKPVLDIDYMMIYPNILRHQVLYVYAKEQRITHIAVVDPTKFSRHEFRPPPGWRLMH
jgi:hypothetical protein